MKKKLLLIFLLVSSVLMLSSFSVLESESENITKDFTEEGERLFSNQFLTVSYGYPSVVSSTLTFDYLLTDDNKQVKIVISNVLGSEVATARMVVSQNKLRFGVEHLSDGIYFYTLYIDGNAHATKKVIIKK